MRLKLGVSAHIGYILRHRRVTVQICRPFLPVFAIFRGPGPLLSGLVRPDLSMDTATAEPQSRQRALGLCWDLSEVSLALTLLRRSAQF